MVKTGFSSGSGDENLRAPRWEALGSWKVHGALLVVQWAFSLGAVEGKLAMAPLDAGGGGISPEALAMARMAGAALFFWVWTTIFRLRMPTTGRDRGQLFGLSAVGIALNQALYLQGLRLTAPVSVALLALTIPVFATVTAVLVRQERARLRSFAGLALALAGALMLTGVRQMDRGAVLVTLNSLAYALYLVFARDHIRRLGAFTVMAWVFLFGTLVFSPLGAPVLLREMFTWGPRSWALCAVVVAVPTVVSYGLNAWALGRAPASVVTIYIYLQPVLTALLAYMHLGHTLSARVLLAAVPIVAGVSLVAFRPAEPASLAPGYQAK